jgi:hypothetical protein
MLLDIYLGRMVVRKKTTLELAQKSKHNFFITHQSPNSAGSENVEKNYNINKNQ